VPKMTRAVVTTSRARPVAPPRGNGWTNRRTDGRVDTQTTLAILRKSP
jgi:hypothetical protein